MDQHACFCHGEAGVRRAAARAAAVVPQQKCREAWIGARRVLLCGGTSSVTKDASVVWASCVGKHSRR